MANKRTVTFTIVSAYNGGVRSDPYTGQEYIEQLEVSGAKTDRLNTFFKDHNRSVDSAIGRVDRIRVEQGSLKADVFFGNDSDSDSILNKYRDGILTDVSIGYSIDDHNIEVREGEPDVVTVTDFSIMELSAVGIGFDQGAKVDRAVKANIMRRIDALSKKLDERSDRKLNKKESRW